jgi:transcriptional regulator with XRE-family HTH domain
MEEAALAAAIGARVRQERQTRGWTLDHLAQTSGVSRRMIISVEQGEANPSVATLLKLSDALGIGLPSLVEPPQSSAMRLTRKGQGAQLWRSEAGGAAILVAGSTPPDVVELWDWTLGPGDEYAGEAHPPGTKELLHVLQGTVTVTAAGQSVTMKPGDAVAFPGDVPHSYSNHTRTKARFSLTVFEPGVGIQKGRS